MKPFFSIAINHDYESTDSEIGISNDLSIVPASMTKEFARNNRLWFRNQAGSIECYIEDDEALKEEVEILFFWVICTNSDFYNYTALPIDIDFSTPKYHWSNTKESNDLEEQAFQNMPLEKPPKNVLGSIGIVVNKVSSNKRFTINFKARETFWAYHIHFKKSQKEWAYKILDKNNQWVFTELYKNEEVIVFESKNIIPFVKTGTGRLRLLWTPIGSPFEEGQSMVLPFADCRYRMINDDNKEVTPVYIHV